MSVSNPNPSQTNTNNQPRPTVTVAPTADQLRQNSGNAQPRPQTAGAPQKDPSILALQFAIETTLNTKKLKEENETLKSKLAENEKLLAEFDDARIRAKSLRTQLKEKEAKLEAKRKELIQIQEAIISTLQSPAQQQQEDPEEALVPIPIIMNRIQELIMSLTESAADKQSTAIPVISLFNTSEKLNKLYDALVEQDIIHETQEEHDERYANYVATQQKIVSQLKDMLAAAQAEGADLEEEEEEIPEEEEEPAKEDAPKVVEVTEEEEKKEESPAPAPEEPKPAETEKKEETPAANEEKPPA